MSFFLKKVTNSNENVGKIWSKQEINELLEEIKTKTIDDIAIIHKRTPTGIISRLRDIASKLNDSGESIKQIMEITKLSEHDITDAINRRLSKKNKQSKKDETNNSEIIKMLINIEYRLNSIETELKRLTTE